MTNDPIRMYEADGLSLKVTIGPVAPATTVPVFTGGTAEVHARAKGGPAIAGVATISGAAEVTVVFAPSALPRGDYSLHVRAGPPATPMQTVGDYDLQVLLSAKTGP